MSENEICHVVRRFTKDSYTTVYVYGGQERDYQIESITGADISDINKIKHIELLKNNLLAIEIKPTKNQKVIINATSMGDKLYLKNNRLRHNAEININLNPITNGPILVNGVVPIVQTTTSATIASMLIMNSGNQATSAITVTYPIGVTMATGSGACNLTSGLAPRASCTLYFTVSNPSNGSGIITFNYGTSAALTVPINWYSLNTGLLIQMAANPATVNFTAGGSVATTVTVTNSGVYTLTGISVSSVTASGSATTVISSNTCTGSLAANANCSFVATISDTVVEANKNIIILLSGSYNNGGSQTYSRILGVGYTTISPVLFAAYVPNFQDSTISMYSMNAATGQLTPLNPATIATGGWSYSMAFDQSGKYVYVPNYTTAKISMYSMNAATGQLTPLNPATVVSTVTSPCGITFDPSGKYVYVTSCGSNGVGMYSMNATTGQLTALNPAVIASNTGAWGITFDLSGQYVYVETSSQIINMYSMNATTGQLTELSPAAIPMGRSAWLNLTFDPSGKFLYATNYYDSTISMYSMNATTGQLTALNPATMASGDHPVDIAFHPSGQYAYVSNQWSGTISMYSMNATTGALVPLSPATISAPNPFHLKMDSSGKYLYVVSAGNNIYSYGINIANGQLSAIGSPVATGTQPMKMIISPNQLN